MPPVEILFTRAGSAPVRVARSCAVGFAGLLCLLPLWSCGGGATSTTSTTTTSTTGGTTTTNAYATAYKALTWGSNATVTYSGSCSMTVTLTGVPPYHAAYYLAPVSTEYPTAVAETPVSHTEMSLVPYTPSAITSATMTFDICPTAASSTTSTSMGTIGYMISGEALFNPYEGDGDSTPAMSDNVSYTFTDSSGASQTASFIDTCNSHPTPLTAGYDWHYHGVPNCLTATVDGASGPSHIIGIALDGYPVYGGRDINGNVISVSQLDSCNGITSATPEFPDGAYHYVLPIGVTGSQSSINCYYGAVTSTQALLASRFICGPMRRRPPNPAHAKSLAAVQTRGRGLT